MAAIAALFGLFMAALVSGQTVDISPKEVVSRVNGDVTVLCRVPYPINSCRMTVGTTSYILNPTSQEGDVVYAGQGLQFGECGAHIKNVKEEWNGDVKCLLPPKSGNIELYATMNLIVARAPEPPSLLSPTQRAFREGETFEAQCVVANGRPAAKITWLIDEEPLFAGVHEPQVNETNGLMTISQSVSRRLSAEDGGRTLACKAEHEAWSGPKIATRQLVVHYQPRRTDGETGLITIFGLKLGAEGRLNVTVRAEPAPSAAWTVSGERLVAPAVNHDSGVEALEPYPLGGGYYNVTLILSRVTKEDVDRTYYLQVHNDLGSEELALKISTMDEPAGVELDTGAIVGIVVGILILLAAITLLVFAKATGRWCFADGRSRNHKSSGESDTESAAGGRPTRMTSFRNRLRAALPRRDRLQPTADQVPAEDKRSRMTELRERLRLALPGRGARAQPPAEATTEEKPLSEEKKGVVYAELALGDQGGDKPPPQPPSAEYAEIVYTEQGEKDAKETKETKD